MMGLLVALCAAAGTYYLYTAVALGWQGLHRGRRRPGGRGADGGRRSGSCRRASAT